MIPLLAIAAWSGTGKNNAAEKLIQHFVRTVFGGRLIKHTHHDMDVDKPGR